MKLPSYNSIRRAAQDHDLAKLNLTADQLASIQGKAGRTGLHEAAIYGCLEQVVGGATAGQLAAALDDYRTSALYPAVVNGHLGQIEGGVTAEELATAKPIADFSIGMVMGTPAELSELSDEEYQARAERLSTSSTGIPQKTALHWLAWNGGLKMVKGGVRFEQLVGLFDDHDTSALSLAVESGQLEEITGGVTAEQLASERNRQGVTPLHAAAQCGHLDQIKGGVTAKQLAGAKDNEGLTPLHLAAIHKSLDQVRGGVTAKDLLSVRTNDGHTGLNCATSLKHIKGGVTARELLESVADCGESALAAAAVFSSFGDITDGVTFEQLAAVKNTFGISGVILAAYSGSFDQIKGGVSITQLASIQNNGETALGMVVVRGHLRKIFKDDPAKFWNELPPSEQALLRQAMDKKVVPQDFAALTGSGTPGREVKLLNGFTEGTNIYFDRNSKGTLAATKKFEKLDLNFPLSKLLVCRCCNHESQVMIPNRNVHRHYCPACGAVHQFNADAYEQEAFKCIRSMRRVFPWTVQFDCKCGTACKHEFKDQVKNKMVCHQCGETYRFAFEEDEQVCFEWMKDRFAGGQDAAGWTCLEPDSEALAA